MSPSIQVGKRLDPYAFEEAQQVRDAGSTPT
jgi:hypothetical protein